LSPIAVHPLTRDSIAPAARLLAGSMRDNPLHRRVFGGDEARLEPLLAGSFDRLLRRQMRSGLVLGAYDRGSLVGAAAMVSPGHCQPNFKDKLGMLMVLARGGALTRLPRIQRWLGCWKRQDPAFDHWHLGPAAVDRARQGQGIGTQLMVAVCGQLDRRRGIGYLETDKEANVRLYRRGGFEIVAEHSVLGVRNWFMLRNPGPPGEVL
jgi:ribosomal protein S18 acetylase RimI-like enzyme